MLTTILAAIDHQRSAHCLRGSRQRQRLLDLPPGLYGHWARTASLEFAGIARSELFYTRAAEALMDFFACVAASGQACALPSKAADSVWHAWLRYSPMTLEQCTLRHFGRVIPHVPAASMAAPLDMALARCLVSARRLVGQAPAGTGLPPLFTLDRRLRMPHGFACQRVGQRIGVSGMDGRGRVLPGMRFPPDLAPAGLLAAGLVSTVEVEQARRQADSSDSSSGSSSCDSDGDSGSSGDSGGCGSSCGGGGD